MIKGIIFDMDGVLIEAKEWHYEALNKALRLFGYEISHYAHLTTYDGLPTKRKLQMLSKEMGLPIKLHNFINELKQEYTMQYIYSCCRPNFVHEYALSRLHGENYKMAVASNAVRNSVETMIQKAHLTPYLQFLLSNEDVNKSKPDPEIYISAISKLGFRPEECLIIEDNENGIKAAQASGAHVLRVEEVNDVNYANISSTITKINTGGIL